MFEIGYYIPMGIKPNLNLIKWYIVRLQSPPSWGLAVARGLPKRKPGDLTVSHAGLPIIGRTCTLGSAPQRDLSLFGGGTLGSPVSIGTRKKTHQNLERKSYTRLGAICKTALSGNPVGLFYKPPRVGCTIFLPGFEPPFYKLPRFTIYA